MCHTPVTYLYPEFAIDSAQSMSNIHFPGSSAVQNSLSLFPLKILQDSRLHNCHILIMGKRLFYIPEAINSIDFPKFKMRKLLWSISFYIYTRYQVQMYLNPGHLLFFYLSSYS